MTYEEYLQSEDWQEKRKRKLAKAKRCSICGSLDNLHVHHLFYRNLVDVQMSDLRIMCQRCHFLGHDLYRRGAFSFKEGASHHSRFGVFRSAVLRELRSPTAPPPQTHIESLRTENGGWTKADLASLGVPWPPPKGWKAKLEGK